MPNKIRCQNYIMKDGNVVMCSRSSTYQVVDNKTKETWEYLCTQHGEKLVNERLVDFDINSVVYKDYWLNQ